MDISIEEIIENYNTYNKLKETSPSLFNDIKKNKIEFCKESYKNNKEQLNSYTNNPKFKSNTNNPEFYCGYKDYIDDIYYNDNVNLHNKKETQFLVCPNCFNYFMTIRDININKNDINNLTVKNCNNTSIKEINDNNYYGVFENTNKSKIFNIKCVLNKNNKIHCNKCFIILGEYNEINDEYYLNNFIV